MHNVGDKPAESEKLNSTVTTSHDLAGRRNTARDENILNSKDEKNI